jgi:DNA polymerase IV
MADSEAGAANLYPHVSSRATNLDLSQLPPVYVLATHLSIDEQHEAEDVLSSGGAPLTYDIKEANLVLANVSRTRRAKSELQWKGVRLEDVSSEDGPHISGSSPAPRDSTPAKKRRRLANARDSRGQRAVEVIDPSTASETEEDQVDTKPMSQLSLSRVSTSSSVETSHPASIPESFTDKVKVVRLDWLNDSLIAGKIQSLGPYTIYEARLLRTGEPAVEFPSMVKSVAIKPDSVIGKGPYLKEGVLPGIVERANADPKPAIKRYNKHSRIKDAARRDVAGKSFSSSTQAASQPHNQSITRPTQLLHQTTSEHDEAVSSTLPALPDWVKEKRIYACERATPLNSPNKDFIAELKKIKLARLLTLDEIGVRAYSTSIASLAAYPYRIQSTREILALPGCDQKITQLFHEYKTTNHLQAVQDLEADPALTVLREFYEIWGVGAKTAREFYYDKGWRDLDDIVEHGWRTLSRVQQIGVKYYDEFLLKLSRAEVESITATITHHAKLVTDANVEIVIVGGYRRGKTESGDVDVILSHRNEAMTYNLVDRVVRSLEKEGWITHTLTLNLTNTKRNQEPLPISAAIQGGHGFDTLDKALVVWQDPDWPTKEADLAANPKAKNPNPHRRVDIIISPWRTVGCAIAGWTSGTTFQRDLRRYAKYRKGWKFDSSGVRERGTGRWIDLEGWSNKRTRCTSWQEAERKVFEGMGLVYREPWDRCTG